MKFSTESYVGMAVKRFKIISARILSFATGILWELGLGEASALLQLRLKFLIQAVLVDHVCIPVPAVVG